MYCSECKSKCKVVDSRPAGWHGIRRRYECLKCKKRFTSYEYLRDAITTKAMPSNIYKVLKNHYSDEEIIGFSAKFMMQIYLTETYGVDFLTVQKEFEVYQELKEWKKIFNDIRVFNAGEINDRRSFF